MSFSKLKGILDLRDLETSLQGCDKISTFSILLTFKCQCVILHMMVTSLVAIEAHRTGKIITNALHFLKEEKI